MLTKLLIGTWTLTAPNGRTWEASSPLHCASREQAERVPAKVALDRIFAALLDDSNDASQATQSAEREQRLQVGDYFTHDRTGTRFVCRSVTKHDYDGKKSVVRAEVDLDAR